MFQIGWNLVCSVQKKSIWLKSGNLKNIQHYSTENGVYYTRKYYMGLIDRN